MATIQHRLPSIAATSTARNAYALLLSNEQALKPFYSAERTAFRKLSAEVKRRGLELDA